MSDHQQLLLCGSKPSIHDRAVKKVGDFEQTIERFRADPSQELAIGLSRFNFFEVIEILKLWHNLTNTQVVKFPPYPLRPVNSIFYRFKLLVEEIKQSQIPIVFLDEDLIPLLKTVERASKLEKTSDPNLLRLLGMVCDQPFIGPNRLLFDPLYACNLDCIYCNNFSVARRNVSKEEMERNPVYRFRGRSIAPERFMAFLKEAKELGVEAISIVGSGEPTLYPHLLEILKFAHELGFAGIDVSTNGIRFSKELTKAAVKYDLSSVTFSITGATKSSFAYFHPNGAKNYRRIMKNIKYLAKLKQKYKTKRPVVAVLHVVTKKNIAELEEVMRQAASVGANKVWFQMIHPREFSKGLELDQNDISRLKEAYKKAKDTAARLFLETSWEFEFQLDKLRPGGSWSGPQLKSCPVGWWFSIITCAERASFCCGWKEVGNIEGKSFKGLWNSEKYQAYRHAGKHIWHFGDVMFDNDKNLLDDFCFYCDNFNFVAEIFGLLEKTDLLKFYVRDEPFDGFRASIIKD